MLTVALAVFLSQAPLAPDTALPLNHPQVPSASATPGPIAPGTPLPPNHPPLPGAADPAPMNQVQAAPSADELLKRLEASGDLKGKEKSFEIAASLGKLYSAHGRYPDAVVFLDQAVAKAEPARTFYLAKKKALGSKSVPTPSAAGCVPGPDETMERQLAKAQAQKDPAFAAACARAALHPLMDVETQLGAAKFLSHDPAGAIAAYARALVLFDSNPEARYGRGAVLLDSKGEDLAALKLAKADFERFLADYPTSPRAKQARSFLSRVDAAIAAGGVSKVKGVPRPAKVDPHAGMQQPAPNQPVQLTQEMIDAVRNVERTPEMAQGFARLIEEGEEHLARGRFQDALDNYRRVIPFEPENARARAGIAWAMVKLNKQPMADNVWGVAAQTPESLDALGEALKSKGDPEQARTLWKKLGETVPGYAGKLTGKL